MTEMKTIRHKILFDANRDAEAVALAKLGASTALITGATGLSEHQVTYRLSKAKGLEGHDHGYRVAWRNGESAEFKQIRNDLLSVLREDIKRSLPKLITHPAPEVKEGR